MQKCEVCHLEFEIPWLYRFYLWFFNQEARTICPSQYCRGGRRRD